VIGVSPERILQDQRFRMLWKSKKFTGKLFNITIDEGHCVSEWGDGFRPLYNELGILRWLLPSHVTFHVASATMPPHILSDVQTKLRINVNRVVKIQRSNDRPNIQLMVVPMLYPKNCFHDLDRVLNFDAGPPKKFMVFVNSRRISEHAVEHCWTQLPTHLRNKIVWFHSGMTMEFRTEIIEKLCKGEIWGIFCTDAAGMVESFFVISIVT
jgi:superfamily II DNA helicase RecQ